MTKFNTVAQHNFIKRKNTQLKSQEKFKNSLPYHRLGLGHKKMAHGEQRLPTLGVFFLLFFTNGTTEDAIPLVGYFQIFNQFNAIPFFFFLAFKPIVFTHDGCSYHQAKTPISFWYKQDLNPSSYLTTRDFTN